MQRVIVTGAHGFLGRHVTRDLRRHGMQVTTLGRHPSSDPSHITMGEAPWSEARVADAIRSVEPDALFHLAGGAVGSPEKLEQLNAGLANTMMAAIAASTLKPLFVCCGSAAEYGAAFVDGVPITETTCCLPVSPYATSKLAQTKAALAFAAARAVPVLVARIFNPIGPGMPEHLALGDFARQIAAIRGSRGVIRTGNVRVFRDFIDVDHVAATLRILAQNPEARGVVNVCSGEAMELQALLRALTEVSGKEVEVLEDSSRLRPGEVRTVIGSTSRLVELGAMPPRTDYKAAVTRLWQHASAGRA